MRRMNTWAASAMALLVVGGCGEDTTGPDAGNDAMNVAVALYEADRPVLYIQNTNGTTRTRVHFEGAVDEIEGNVPDLLPVTDAQLKAIGPMEWSPDGTRLAVVVTLAHDQSQVVVMDRDGGNMRTASPNTQIILSDVAWSADGRSIAYTMSTRPQAQAVDVFTTDLTTNRVTRLTNTADYGRPGVTLAWSADNAAVFVSRVAGTTGSGSLEEDVSRIDRIAVADGATTTHAADLAGPVQAIGANGAFALTLRKSGFDGAEVQRRLYREDLVAHTATALTAAAPFHWAELSSTGSRIVVGENTAAGDVALEYRVLTPAGAEVATLRGIGSGTAIVEVYY